MKKSKLNKMSLIELALFGKIKETKRRKSLAQVLTDLASKEFIEKGRVDPLVEIMQKEEIKGARASIKKLREELTSKVLQASK